MSDAEATVKHAIMSGIIDTWHSQNPKSTRDAIFEQIFSPHLKWAVEEYLKESEDKKH